MKSLITFALLTLVSTATLADGQKHFQKPLPAPTADSKPDPAMTDEEIRGQVRAYLGSIDTPIGLARWKALGPRAETPLLEVLNGQALPTRRAKAIDGLSAIGTSHTDLFKTIAEDEKEPYVVRYAAMRGIGYLVPKDQMIAQLTPLLEKSKDQRVRAAAGAVLALHAPETCPTVRAQINREEASNRLRYTRAMDACFGQQ